MMEEGRVGRSGLRGRGGWSEESLEKEDLYQRPRKKKSRKKLWILLGCSIVVLVIVVVVAVVVSKKKAGDSSADSSLEGKDRANIPAKWQNTYLDPWAWQTTKDFNVTFTDEMVGGLPVMGLFTDWDDSNRANDKVPPLQDKWGSYGDKPARGVNLGGWLTLEPFITPSLFNYNAKLGIVDEYNLCKHLGASAAKTLEAHYDSFVSEDTFRAIAAAGLDHVRIPFSHWAVENYDGDPYVFRTSWRYLLRGIEWARKHGLRVNLDLHSLPGSQNGWNHSGRFGAIGWFNGTDGQTNAKRSLELHDRLSKFFAQARYRNIVTHYGLVNEPRMTFLPLGDVVSWTKAANKVVRGNGVDALVVFGDGFMGLDKWQGLLPGDMVLDVHQYVIFNENQIDFTHRKKVQYACDGWTQQTELSMDPARGHGPTVFAEWSQADTDCARHLTGVGWGNRWQGTYDTGDEATSTLTPRCPAKDASCSCSKANQDPAQFSADYKKFLRMFAEAQMHSFEKGWGWWYWTWKTESAPLWSYEAGLEAGILPAKAYEPDFKCDADVPDFAKDGLSETY
ncbi:cellulase (glycosyl hydrolase family 5) domain-containing protein [Hirsutella rhossiliensis]|uniref:glucan 1,3-beta-glucosidase n=1 Tax=Hirsutella rhossiliensis TaxID=111463 RepID=A0A9P8SEB1_9HYPO|nr:cellulase (glycosyl hydrolase family 5) domain-containing protein [Hirsutella rhossiliensis]KAH0958789.1 cellulase (glycosyl hydrolase family 5) domain-containing protein [Hirsutella rhossiliensis]